MMFLLGLSPELTLLFFQLTTQPVLSFAIVIGFLVIPPFKPRRLPVQLFTLLDCPSRDLPIFPEERSPLLQLL